MNGNKKFIEVFDTDEWEVETDTGWEDVVASGKTIKYKIFELILENNLVLRGADNHIVINDKNKEVYLCELKINDYVKVKNGISKVISIQETNEYEEMYDIEIKSDNHTYYTNDILSHNSTWLGNLALQSVKLGQNTAYITFELQEEIVNMRIGSNMFTVPLDDYENWAKDQDQLKAKIKSFKQSSIIPPGILHVKEFGASTCSVNDLRTYLKKAEEMLGVKFDNIFVDYINIMKNWRNPNTENTYIKIKQIAEDLRAMAMEEHWAVVTATQTNRSGWETNDLNITNISESGALLHTVDALFGIITNAEMKARKEYYLKCLANRVAGYENTKKRYTIEWKYARIEEDKNSPIQDMDFLINNTIHPPSNSTPRGGMASPQVFVGAVMDSPGYSSTTVGETKDKEGEVNITGSNLF